MMEVRLPRLLAAFGVGGLLALSGVLLQALFRNPLADPFVLGVSGGAAVGALLAMITGAAAAGGSVRSCARCVGGCSGRVSPRSWRWDLAAVAHGRCGCERLRGARECVARAGRLGAASRHGVLAGWGPGWALSPWSSVVAAVLAAGLALLVARPLNVLAAGELRARSVGLQIEVWRTVLFVACAALTAIAVINAGTVGFVGLITPHAIRLAFRTSDHRIVAPASVVLGGTMLAAADLLARTMASPRQLPVGAIMALVGAPMFMRCCGGAGAGDLAVTHFLADDVLRDFDAVAAGTLGPVEGGVSFGDQLFRELAVVGLGLAVGAGGGHTDRQRDLLGAWLATTIGAPRTASNTRWPLARRRRPSRGATLWRTRRRRNARPCR